MTRDEASSIEAEGLLFLRSSKLTHDYKKPASRFFVWVGNLAGLIGFVYVCLTELTENWTGLFSL